MSQASRVARRSGADAFFEARWIGPALFAAALLVSAWTLRYRVPGGDEGAILTQAARILRGAVYYRDLDAYPLPGASYLLAGFFWLFGESVQSARVLAALVFGAIVVAMHAIAREIVDARRAFLAAASLLAFKFIAWPGLTAYTYWDAAFAFSCIAIALYLRQAPRLTSRRLFSTGACVGLAILCKQNLGIYLWIALSALVLAPQIAFEKVAFGKLAPADAEPSGRLRAWSFLAGGTAAVLAPVAGAFAAAGTLPALAYSVVVRPFVGYLPTSGLAFSTPLRWWEFGSLQGMAGLPYFVEPWWQMVRRAELPGDVGMQAFYATLGELFARLFYTAIVAILLAVALRWFSAFRKRELDAAANAGGRVFALLVLALAATASAFPRADFPHLISIFPLLIVLGFHLGQRAQERGARAWIPSVENGSVGALLVGSALLVSIQQAHLTTPLELERASLRISPENAYVASVVRYVREELQPGDPLFVAVHEAHYYFLSDRYYDWPFVQLYPGMTGDSESREITAEIEAHPPKLLIRGIELEGVPRLRDYAPRLETWIETHYQRDDRVFRRHPTPGGPPPTSWIQVLRPRRAPGGSS